MSVVTGDPSRLITRDRFGLQDARLAGIELKDIAKATGDGSGLTGGYLALAIECAQERHRDY